MAAKSPLTVPQFTLLTGLVVPSGGHRAQSIVGYEDLGDGWIKAPSHFRVDVATALVRKGMAELEWPGGTGCPYMRATEAGRVHWNEVNARLRAK